MSVNLLNLLKANSAQSKAVLCRSLGTSYMAVAVVDEEGNPAAGAPRLLKWSETGWWLIMWCCANHKRTEEGN